MAWEAKGQPSHRSIRVSPPTNSSPLPVISSVVVATTRVSTTAPRTTVVVTVCKARTYVIEIARQKGHQKYRIVGVERMMKQQSSRYVEYPVYREN